MAGIIRFILIVGLLKLVYSDEFTIDDGSQPKADGETQNGAEVKLVYEIDPAAISDRLILEFKAQGSEEWEAVSESGVRKGRWQSDAYNLEEGGTDTIIETFTIKAATLSDAGTYRYKKVDKNDKSIVRGEKSKELKIYAQTEELRLEGITNGKYKVKANENKQVTCKAVNGSRPSTMELYVDGQKKEDMTIDNALNEEGVFEGSVFYKFSGEEDKKSISCKSSVKTYEPIESLATLEIIAPPNVNCPTKTRTAKVGTEVTFTCTVTGKPTPTAADVTWFAKKLGRSLKGNEDNKVFGLTSSTSTSTDGSLTVTLKVLVEESYFGEKYTLTVQNDNGSNQDSVTITKAGEVRDDTGGDASALSAFTLLVGSCLILLLL